MAAGVALAILIVAICHLLCLHYHLVWRWAVLGEQAIYANAVLATLGACALLLLLVRLNYCKCHQWTRK